MADQTVLDRPTHFTHEDACDALRNTSQAMAILRAVSLAVTAQGNGAARFDDDSVSRWQPSIDAACERVGVVRFLMNERVGSPVDVEWWTPITMLEALGAALWNRNQGGTADELSDEEMQGCLDAVQESLCRVRASLLTAADRLKPQAEKCTFNDD